MCFNWAPNGDILLVSKSFQFSFTLLLVVYLIREILYEGSNFFPGRLFF